MPREAGSPADWLRFARSDLALASQPAVGPVLWETLCFHAQQAAEKSLKAVLLSKGLRAPRTHNLKTLLEALFPTMAVPPDVAACAALTDYAVTTRYPGEYEDVDEMEHREAVRVAKAALEWAEDVLGPAGTPRDRGS